MPAIALETMNAIVLHAVGDLRYEQVPIPILRPGTVRVRIGFCGVCGSDIPRCFSKGTYSFPTICGHEFAGTVEECGEGVVNFQPGDRVAVFPLLWRDDHAACEQGKYAQSDGYDYLGSRSDGGFSEYVIAPERNLIRVPDNVSLEEAAMTEPAAVALHAVRRAKVRLGDSVAVFGLGPIGLMVAQWLKAAGAGPICLFDIQPEKLEIARSLGFQHTFDSRTSDAIEVVSQLTSGHGVHVAIEAAGVPPTMLAALKTARCSGRVVLLGNPSADVTLPAQLISQAMRREINILGVWNSDFSVYGDDDDWRTVLAAMSSGTLNLKPLITHRLPLSEGVVALEMMREQSESFTKVLIHP
ncbi:galactitol-1-phosphate 5-dehydrogenase [Blastopirellula marina]|uniref:Galactitol-1-phosphate 5-dehydrogenase n=1 Tax=Blastopirellula marina TaxID=124 RepID=A0A2S8FA71_9BACT|nr:galactitol-1-phosphate 5-dehydrogenase [Blastopirellula marina]PQO29032.1 galactitol-1-phosphate 5-dehydrogenase [Blastopirellula marina]PTL42304.1 galactitol-1-phosphate 5-dehydrogenase [Blastopirellula marina]